jgi:uncharacterized phage protein (TIGR01671 family)
MREIKFRALIEKRRIHNDRVIREREIVKVESIDFNTGRIKYPILSDVHGSQKEVHPLELIQYTGLKDKNGVEIYEDDIIEGFDPKYLGGDRYVGRVFYWDEEAAFYHGFHEGRPPKRMWKDVKVIGNIYENPELIK